MKQRILLAGKQGIDLLQRITTLDIARVGMDSLQPGLILSPQGKILSYFEVRVLIKHETLEIISDDSFLKLLDQYTFSERYSLEAQPLPGSEPNPAEELKRIRSRIPLPGKEFDCDGQTNPLEINLAQAIHDQKGCYPGQEVIEKIISIGAPAKRLCLVKLQSTQNDQVSNSLKALPIETDGAILTSFQYPYGLAILRKTLATVGTRIRWSEVEFEVIES